jgi:hypothetical protein
MHSFSSPGPNRDPRALDKQPDYGPRQPLRSDLGVASRLNQGEFVRNDQSADVVADLSAFIISGAVKSRPEPSDYQTVGRSPAQGIDDGVLAERLGFSRAWLCERLDIKQLDVNGGACLGTDGAAALATILSRD